MDRVASAVGEAEEPAPLRDARQLGDCDLLGSAELERIEYTHGAATLAGFGEASERRAEVGGALLMLIIVHDGNDASNM